MSPELTTALVALITAITTAIVSIIAAKGKADASFTDTLKTEVESVRTWHRRTEADYNECRDNLRACRRERDELEQCNRAKDRTIHSLEQENQRLKAELKQRGTDNHSHHA